MAVRTESYATAVEGIEELLGIRPSATTLWRVVQQTGQAVWERQQAAAQQAWSMPERGQVVKGEQALQQKMGIALDGVYIYVRDEGWKEVKLGAVFEIAPLTSREKVQRLKRHSQPAQVADEIRDMVKAKAVSYCARLGSVEEFEPLQWAEAVRRGLPRCWESVVIGDGAEWIDRIYAACYYDSVRIVDWYHACEHLGGLARQAFGEGSQKGQTWLKQRKDHLWRGQVSPVMHAIRQLPIDPAHRAREANYFAKHRHRMNYLEFCERGLPVGSGVVEGGGCKGVIEGRLKCVGMRWSRPGAQRMIALRCEHASRRWKQIWAA
jgi:hypothetical protein